MDWLAEPYVLGVGIYLLFAFFIMRKYVDNTMDLSMHVWLVVWVTAPFVFVYGFLKGVFKRFGP